MPEQLDLLGGHRTTTATAALTARQQTVWNLIRQVGGVTADEAGAALHEAAGKHPDGGRCPWCTRDGRAVLTSKALKPLVVRKRSGEWRPRNPGAAVRDRPGVIATSQPLSPDNPFYDL